MKNKILELDLKSIVPGQSEKPDTDKVLLSLEGGSVFGNNMVDEFLIGLKTLITGGIERIVIDMSNVEALTSSEIGAIINLTKMVRIPGGDLVLYNINSKIEQIIAPLDLNRFIKIFDDKKEVINHFRYVKV